MSHGEEGEDRVLYGRMSSSRKLSKDLSARLPGVSHVLDFVSNATDAYFFKSLWNKSVRRKHSDQWSSKRQQCTWVRTRTLPRAKGARIAFVFAKDARGLGKIIPVREPSLSFSVADTRLNCMRCSNHPVHDCAIDFAPSCLTNEAIQAFKRAGLREGVTTNEELLDVIKRSNATPVKTSSGAKVLRASERYPPCASFAH